MSMRVLIAVTHLLGAGHLTRAAAIARAFARAGHEVALVSGGTRTPLVSTAGVQTGAVYKITLARPDLKITEMGAPINSRMGLNTWASFVGTNAINITITTYYTHLSEKSLSCQLTLRTALTRVL